MALNFYAVAYFLSNFNNQMSNYFQLSFHLLHFSPLLFSFWWTVLRTLEAFLIQILFCDKAVLSQEIKYTHARTLV